MGEWFIVKEKRYTQHVILQHKCLHYRKKVQSKSQELIQFLENISITLLDRRVNPGSTLQKLTVIFSI